MALILNIDTATDRASICLSKGGRPIKVTTHEETQTHAAWLHTAIQQMIKSSGHSLKDLNAIAVTEGPGSYTGLRVSMAAAKGLCYALNIPLITETTLAVMAHAAAHNLEPGIDALVPMIDARRMEVFTAIYNRELMQMMHAQPMILDENSFWETLMTGTALFFGSGSEKWKNICTSPNAVFRNVNWSAVHLAQIAELKYKQQAFTDIIYSEPAYIKNFYTHVKK